MNKLYETTKSCLGQNLAPRNKELGCVEALANVFKQATGEELGENDSTYKLYLLLINDKRFKEPVDILPGDIILSPTFNGTGKVNNGHTGIVGENGEIFSNDSLFLKWNNHWTIEKWKNYYVKKGGFLLKFYRYIEKEPPPIEKPPEKPNLTKLQAILEQLRVILEELARKVGLK